MKRYLDATQMSSIRSFPALLLATITLSSCFESGNKPAAHSAPLVSRAADAGKTDDLTQATSHAEALVRQVVTGAHKHSGWIICGQHWLDEIADGNYSAARKRLSPELQEQIDEALYAKACAYDKQTSVSDGGRLHSTIVSYNTPSSLPGSKIQIASMVVSLETTSGPNSERLPAGQGGILLFKRSDATPWEIADYFGLPGHRVLVLSGLNSRRTKKNVPEATVELNASK